MVASHLLDTRRFQTGLDALEWFSMRRTEVEVNKKKNPPASGSRGEANIEADSVAGANGVRMQGVDGAGQRRYVGYYSHIIYKGLPPAPVTLFLSHVRVHTIPQLR